MSATANALLNKIRAISARANKLRHEAQWLENQARQIQKSGCEEDAGYLANSMIFSARQKRKEADRIEAEEGGPLAAAYAEVQRKLGINAEKKGLMFAAQREISAARSDGG